MPVCVRVFLTKSALKCDIFSDTSVMDIVEQLVAGVRQATERTIKAESGNRVRLI